jgi:predicted enzyme involved in methoxymalonyl-ACP biosynthesis
MGKGAEEAFIAKLAEAAAMTLDCIELRGTYIPTAKNSMVKGLYARLNFTGSAKPMNGSLKLEALPNKRHASRCHPTL